MPVLARTCSDLRGSGVPCARRRRPESGRAPDRQDAPRRGARPAGRTDGRRARGPRRQRGGGATDWHRHARRLVHPGNRRGFHALADELRDRDLRGREVRIRWIEDGHRLRRSRVGQENDPRPVHRRQRRDPSRGAPRRRPERRMAAPRSGCAPGASRQRRPEGTWTGAGCTGSVTGQRASRATWISTCTSTQDTFRHVATVYSWSRAQNLGPTMESSSQQSEVNFRLEERFADFERIKGLTLPTTWSLLYEQSANTTLVWRYKFKVSAVERK